MRIALMAIAGTVAISSCVSAPIAAAPGVEAGDWPAYGRTALGARHSPLSQITPGNVGQLEVAWRFRTGAAFALPQTR